MLIDTHAHLADPCFDADRDAVLARAARAGVGLVVAVAEDADDAAKNLALAERYPGRVLAAAGLHPDRPDPDEAEAVLALLRREAARLVAIGEVGLDYWRVQDEEGRARQRAILARFVDASLELDLPLNVHSRAAGRETVALLLERGARRVQLHAFDGRAAKALPAVAAGYFFSIPPSIVRSRQKQKLAARLPVEALLLESDSPVLGPTAGERNEPASLRIALEALAAIKEVPAATLERILEENTRRLYRLDGGAAAAPSALP